jgi:hypothetical protein
MNNHFLIAESKLSYSEAAAKYEKVLTGVVLNPSDCPHHPGLDQLVAVS